MATPRPRTAGCLPDAFQEPRRSCSPHLVVGLLPATRSSGDLLSLWGCCTLTHDAVLRRVDPVHLAFHFVFYFVDYAFHFVMATPSA